MKIYEVHPSLICAMSTSTNSMPYPLVPQCLCTADCHIHHPSSHHCHSTYSIAHGAAPRSECEGSRATPPAPSNARAARLDGDDLGGRRVEGTLRLATTCYDLLRLATTWRSVTYPLHILYTLHSILSMPAQSAHCSVTLSDSNVRFVTSVPGDCGCDLPTADPVPTLQ